MKRNLNNLHRYILIKLGKKNTFIKDFYFDEFPSGEYSYSELFHTRSLQDKNFCIMEGLEPSDAKYRIEDITKLQKNLEFLATLNDPKSDEIIKESCAALTRLLS